MKVIKKGEWIASPQNLGNGVVDFRKNFAVLKPVEKATLYVTSMGVYVPMLNGERIGEFVLAPGLTSYNHRVQVQAYDVKDKMTAENTLSIRVGKGWADAGLIGYLDKENKIADGVCLLAWIEIVYTDGEKIDIGTDESWEAYSHEVVFAAIYHGETVDKTAKIQRIGNAVISDFNTSLVMQEGETIGEQERIAPVEYIITPKGERVIDFGQNMTGYVEIRVKGKRGSKIVLHYAEVLDKEGNFYIENYRSAKNEVTYVLSGKEDILKPEFSFQGFRYVELVEYPFDQVDLSRFTAIVVHSNLKRTGSFVCGNEKINQLYHNVVWGQKSNYLDIPTDCPQRDERLGWTGDAQVFCKTATLNYDVEKFFQKWLGDMALEQSREGAIGGIVPTPLRWGFGNISAAWSDSACIIPWEIYLAYGNKELLRKNFPMMKKWVDYVRGVGENEYLWLGGKHFGDWLAMDAGEGSYEGATSKDLIATAFYANSTAFLVKAGLELGEDVTAYQALYVNIVESFRAYFMENGMPKAEIIDSFEEVPNQGGVPRKGITQTAITLILYFHLCKEEERGKLCEKLVCLIQENGWRMTTGFVGTPYILFALSENGYVDVAYRLLFQEKTPSWLYSVNHGATTMWEHWDGLKEDGSFWSSDMNSFNHYAYGAVFDWIFSVACGIKPLEPAYKTISIEPHPNKELGFVKTSYLTRNGCIKLHWYYKGDRVCYEVSVPQGVTANLKLPTGYTQVLRAGNYLF